MFPWSAVPPERRKRLPPADSIREFNVLAASYSAEYGRTAGAMVTLITNSGTNLLHGAAYGYFRNEDLDANNYFNNLLGKPRSEDRYNLFGGKARRPAVDPEGLRRKQQNLLLRELRRSDPGFAV